MLCDGCHENEAVVFYTEIINGEKRRNSICVRPVRPRRPAWIIHLFL